MNQLLQASVVSLLFAAACVQRHAATDLAVAKLEPELIVATAQQPPETFDRYDFDVADPPPTARSIEPFRGIVRGMSLPEVVKLCGVPDRNISLGRYCLLYKLSDGSTVEVFASSTLKVDRVTHGNEVLLDDPEPAKPLEPARDDPKLDSGGRTFPQRVPNPSPNP